MRDLKAAWKQLRAHAGTYPDAYEEQPWGELAVKVRKKIFVFLGPEPGPKLSFSVKLPDSKGSVLELPQANPTGYGLGRHGWVSLAFTDGDEVPIEDVLDWVDESFRAVAPKSLVRKLHDRAEAVEIAVEPVLEGLRILLVGDDPLRLERAREAIGARGADVVGTDLANGLDHAGAGDPDAVVVDLSRNAQQAIALIADLGLVTGGPLVVAGVRSAKMEATVQAQGELALVSREPPGDPAFVALLTARLGR